MCSKARRQGLKPLGGLLVLAALAALATSATGCGKKGPPLPPLRFVPASVKDLVVSQQGNRLLLDFSYPKTTAAGQALGTVTEVDVYQVTRPAPSVGAPAAPAATTPPAPTTPAPAAAPAAAPATTPPATPAPTAAAAPATPAAPGTPPAPAAPAPPPLAPGASPTDPQPLPGREYTSSAKVLLKLKGAEVGAAAQGDRIVVDLPLPEPFPEKPEVRYFTVKTLGPHGDASGYSNQTVILPRPAPAPPANTKVVARAEGVELTWAEPAGALGPGGIVGYNIYRRDSQAKGFGPAIHAAAAPDRSYVDTTARYGQSYIYVVTAVARRSPVIESSIKTEIEMKYVDRFAPPVPREAVALVEAGRVRLVWRGSEAPDLAGYKIYRAEVRKKGTSEYGLLTATPLTDVQYTDSNVRPGATYIYRITAIDQMGNESEPAEVRAAAQ